MKKILSTVLLASLSIGLFAACNNTNTTTSAPGGDSTAQGTDAENDGGDTGSGETTTLNVTMALSEEEWAVMREKVFPAFEAENNAKIEAVQIEASDVTRQLQAMKSANRMEIDLIAQDVNNTAQLVYGELMEDLSEYTDMLPDATIGKIADSGVFDGKTYFMPYRPNVEINYYNENKFNELGVEAPTNWDELLEVAKAFHEAEGLGRVALKLKLSGDVIEIAEFIRQAGGDPLDLRSEGTKVAYEYLQELWPYLSENTLTAGFSSSNDFLAREEVYYIPNWPFGVNIVVRDGGKEEIKVNSGFEGPEGRVKTLGGEVLGIPVGAPNKDLAVKLIEYLQSAEVQETLLIENGWPSFRDDIGGAVDEWQKPYFETTLEALEVAEALPNVRYWGEVNQALNDSLKEVVMDGANVEETLEKYAQIVDRAKEAAEAQ